jgi:hypothetical protein
MDTKEMKKRGDAREEIMRNVADSRERSITQGRAPRSIFQLATIIAHPGDAAWSIVESRM